VSSALAPKEFMMQSGLHAIGWGLSRFVMALGVTALAILLAYATLVFVIVAVQAAGAWGQ
jgi:hypothetical protein